MELQKVAGPLAEAGYALYAVSYDAVDVLGGFAERYGIAYPLLADAGSTVITELGLLNAEAPAPVAGICHPGVFVLDGDGRVTAKRFYPSYRERDTGGGLLAHVLGIASPVTGPEASTWGEAVTLRAGFDRERYAWGQRLWLTVEVEPSAGYHLNGPSVPDGYEPLAVRLRLPQRVVAGEIVWPSAREHVLAGIGETVPVYDTAVRLEIPVTFMVVDAGPLEVGIDVSYQACTDQDCLLPASASLSLTVAEETLVERPRPAAG